MSAGRLRVLIVHNRYRSEQPSGENHIVDQESALLADAGHHVIKFERRSDDIASMSPLARASVPLKVPWNTAVRAELGELLHRHRPDVVHIHNTFPLVSPSAVAACADAGIPAVATLHNYRQVCPRGDLYRNGQICMDCVGQLPLPALRHGCYRDSRLATLPLTVNLVANRRRWWSGVTFFFCVSDAQKKVLIQAGMPAQRLIVKPHFVPDPGIRRARPGDHVLCLSRIDEAKGLPLLMAAWDLIAASGGIGMPLVLAGAGPLEGAVARWANNRKDVQYLGLQSRAECSKLMVRAAVLVVPSVWLETFGLVLVEAMAAAVPAVAAAHGGCGDLVDDHVTGLLHQPGDAASLADCLRRAVADTGWNLALGNAARHRYERHFTPEVGLAALVRGYERAIAAAGCGERW
jgi:glycosyltransferase involved in cell wall biosynthesis